MKIESFLPVFPGFYNTIFEADEESMIEDGKTSEDYDWDYADYHNRVARACVGHIESELKDFGLKITFQALISPKFYNYTNDSINVEYSIRSLKGIRDYLHLNSEAFQEYLTEHYTSRSGFHSFHSTDIEDWVKNLDDEYKFGSVLNFILHNENEDPQETMHSWVSGEMYVSGELKEAV